MPRRDLSAAEVSQRSEECAAWLPPIDDDDDGRKAGRGVRERERESKAAIYQSGHPPKDTLAASPPRFEFILFYALKPYSVFDYLFLNDIRYPQV